MRRWSIPTLTFALLFSLSSLAWAQTPAVTPSPYVYRIVASQCAQQPQERTQTGFRIKDKAAVGIVTALHGVADCKSIAAVPDDVIGSLNNLAIAKVDIGHDVALLWSAQIEHMPLEGLVPEDESSKSLYEGLYVIGYHSGISVQAPPEPLVLREKAMLVDLVPDAFLRALGKRKSPALEIEVLNLSGNLLPGHSGAPILNGNNRVVGVGNGGIDLGRVGWGWAIPWHEIEWKVVLPVRPGEKVSEADRQGMLALAAISPQLVFNFTDPTPATLTPTLIPTSTSTPRPTISSTRKKGVPSVRVVGAGATRGIDLAAPDVNQK